MRTLRALGLAAVILVTGAAAHAQAGVYVGFGRPAVYAAAYVPPCPGPGYFWTAGYYNGGFWVPGRWEFRREYAVRRGYDARFYDRDRFAGRSAYEHERWHGGYAHFDRDRQVDRDRHEDRDRDHNRDRDHQGYRR